MEHPLCCLSLALEYSMGPLCSQNPEVEEGTRDVIPTNALKEERHLDIGGSESRKHKHVDTHNGHGNWNKEHVNFSLLIHSTKKDT